MKDMLKKKGTFWIICGNKKYSFEKYIDLIIDNASRNKHCLKHNWTDDIRCFVWELNEYFRHNSLKLSHNKRINKTDWFIKEQILILKQISTIKHIYLEQQKKKHLCKKE